ncbi:MAG: hypothetical protein JNL25_10185 [Rhodospirillaceae bacterium]|nr:hypothetical protein [Rhodospirillaceae bacterium]
MQQVQSRGSTPAESPAWEVDGRCHERLPEAVRRQQRFGSAAAATLAEAVAHRREIDRAAVQLGRRIAGARPRDGGDGGNGSMVLGASADPAVKLEDGDNWISLRDAGLAVLALIADQRGGVPRDHG